jgi:hypothetical protein
MKEATWIRCFRIIAIALILLFAVFFIGKNMVDYFNGYQMICAAD